MPTNLFSICISAGRRGSADCSQARRSCGIRRGRRDDRPPRAADPCVPTYRCRRRRRRDRPDRRDCRLDRSSSGRRRAAPRRGPPKPGGAHETDKRPIIHVFGRGETLGRLLAVRRRRVRAEKLHRELHLALSGSCAGRGRALRGGFQSDGGGAAACRLLRGLLRRGRGLLLGHLRRGGAAAGGADAGAAAAGAGAGAGAEAREAPPRGSSPRAPRAPVRRRRGHRRRGRLVPTDSPFIAASKPPGAGFASSIFVAGAGMVFGAAGAARARGRAAAALGAGLAGAGLAAGATRAPVLISADPVRGPSAAPEAPPYPPPPSPPPLPVRARVRARARARRRRPSARPPRGIRRRSRAQCVSPGGAARSGHARSAHHRARGHSRVALRPAEEARGWGTVGGVALRGRGVATRSAPPPPPPRWRAGASLRAYQRRRA